jgi:phosphate transport system substrate-binding protein
MLIFILNVLLSFSVKAQSVIKVDGSSTVFPITEAMAEEFQTSKKGTVRVTVGISGTGGGFKKFCRGETDLQNASRPISSSEIESCRAAGVKYIELPVAYDAIVIVVNPKNKWLKEITTAQLRKIWAPEAQEKIMSWSDVDPSWPKEKLKIFGAGSDSGTFDFFTEAIVGKAKSSRGDYTASEDDNTIVLGISRDEFALGYLPLSYYETNKTKLKALALISKDKKAVSPTIKNVEDASYYLSRPVFIYVAGSIDKKTQVKDFVEFYLNNAKKITTEVQFVSFPQKAYDVSLEHLKKRRWGTVFNGKEAIGLSINELLKRESKQ